MALVECRECGKSVAGNAKTCPQCGFDAPNPEIFDLLQTAAGFGVKHSDFESYDAETIRQKARDGLEAMALADMIDEANKQKERSRSRNVLIQWIIIALLGIAYFTGLLDPILRRLLT